MNYESYFNRIEDAIGRHHLADRIVEEKWKESVVPELDKISRDSARELEVETGIPYLKPNYSLHYDEAPPTRLLSLEMTLAYWLGFQMNEKQPCPTQAFSASDSFRRIKEAFDLGVEKSIRSRETRNA
jgi:hypothetical protein